MVYQITGNSMGSSTVCSASKKTKPDITGRCERNVQDTTGFSSENVSYDESSHVMMSSWVITGNQKGHGINKSAFVDKVTIQSTYLALKGQLQMGV